MFLSSPIGCSSCVPWVLGAGMLAHTQLCQALLGRCLCPWLSLQLTLAPPFLFKRGW